MEKPFYLFNPVEATASGDNAGYWSNEYGWTVKECATVFYSTSAVKHFIWCNPDTVIVYKKY